MARFTAVSLGNAGTKTLLVAIGDGAGACATSPATVTIECIGVPNCNVTAPTFDPSARVALNGVSLANGGDRVSSDGSVYQTKLQVSTTVENGQPVSLSVDGGAPLYSVALNGTATFNGVTLVPDGLHSVVGTCVARSGVNGGVFCVAPQRRLGGTGSQPLEGNGNERAITLGTPGWRSLRAR
ncbi:MAG: hypothetical protein QM784_15050 [Polyangiaceae bacterium]